MASFNLTETSSLRAHAGAGHRRGDTTPGVMIAERADVAICSLIARRGAIDRLAHCVQSTFKLELPRTPRHKGDGAIAFAWAGPDQWLALAERTTGPAWEQRLREAVGDAAAIIDQSHGRTLIRVAGPRARDTLAKGVLIDLHPNAFGPGCVAGTVISYIGVHFWQIDATPAYELSVAGSFALALLEWLDEAAAEFGRAYGGG